MDLCEGGQLFGWVRARGRPLSAREQRRLASDLLHGLEYLHDHGACPAQILPPSSAAFFHRLLLPSSSVFSCRLFPPSLLLSSSTPGVIHRDIKPANCLLADASDGARLRICDFGLCALLHKSSDKSSSTGRETVSAGGFGGVSPASGGGAHVRAVTAEPQPRKSGGLSRLWNQSLSPSRHASGRASGRASVASLRSAGFLRHSGKLRRGVNGEIKGGVNGDVKEEEEVREEVDWDVREEVDWEVREEVNLAVKPEAARRPATLPLAESLARGLIGTPSFMAPEVLLCAAENDAELTRAGYSFPCDMWSAGGVIFAMLEGRPEGPFHSRTTPEVLDRILQGKPPLERLSNYDARDLISHLLVPNPARTKRRHPVKTQQPQTSSHTCLCPSRRERKKVLP